MKYDSNELFEDSQFVFIAAAKAAEDRGLTGSDFAFYLLAIIHGAADMWIATAQQLDKKDTTDADFLGIIEALRGDK